ncbi:unnamed protein product, partial [Schistosoma curassoni]|uniref:ASH domain-containing protein n=1 Tax=Schistosoma curassoni TaxID=6186 RepID=A0A183KW79_9TREM
VNDSYFILKNEILFQFNHFNHNDIQSNFNNSIINNNNNNNNINDLFKLYTQITIIRPKFKLFPNDNLNFHTVLIGQIKRIEIKIQNLTQTSTFWSIQQYDINSFVLRGTHQQGIPVILRELMLTDGFDPVSPSFKVKIQ